MGNSKLEQLTSKINELLSKKDYVILAIDGRCGLENVFDTSLYANVALAAALVNQDHLFGSLNVCHFENPPNKIFRNFSETYFRQKISFLH